MTSHAASPFITYPPAHARLLFVAEGEVPAEKLIPGSTTTFIATHYAGEGGGKRGRLPLPSQDTVLSWLAQADIHQDTDIVVYDAGNGSHAARAWWVLNWAGHQRVWILEGGLKGWQAAAPEEENISPAAGAFREITTEDIARDPEHFLLVDARNSKAFAGDGIAPSHLPGAINLPVASLQDEQGKLLPREQRKKQIEALGLTESLRPVVAYCGSGIASAWLAAALQDLEIDAALYVGSWSAWSAREA